MELHETLRYCSWRQVDKNEEMIFEIKKSIKSNKIKSMNNAIERE